MEDAPIEIVAETKLKAGAGGGAQRARLTVLVKS